VLSCHDIVGLTKAKFGKGTPSPLLPNLKNLNPSDQILTLASLTQLLPDSLDLWFLQAQTAAGLGRIKIAENSLSHLKNSKGSHLWEKEILRTFLKINFPLHALEVLNASKHSDAIPSYLRLRLAKKLLETKDTRNGLTILKDLAKKFPENFTYTLSYGKALIISGKTNLALEFLTKAEKIAKTPAHLHSVSFGYQRINRFHSAQRILLALTAAAPKNPIYLKDLGIVQHQMGEIEGSIRNLKKALSLDPKMIESYITLGTIYLDSNRPTLALQTVEEGLKFFSGPLSHPHFLLLKNFQKSLRIPQ